MDSRPLRAATLGGSGGPSWPRVVKRNCYVLSPSGSALRDSGRKVTEESHDQRIKSLNYKIFLKSFLERQPKKGLHRASSMGTLAPTTSSSRG